MGSHSLSVLGFSLGFLRALCSVLIGSAGRCAAIYGGAVDLAVVRVSCAFLALVFHFHLLPSEISGCLK